jgi:hypothetical protein
MHEKSSLKIELMLAIQYVYFLSESNISLHNIDEPAILSGYRRYGY